jgi:16S rRNA (cytidine1402-2'-O)-methyltransferase
VSDPGSRIVNAIWKAGLSVCPIAGPSALTTALSAAGFPLNTEKGVLFLGFLASNEKKKFKSQLETIHKHTGTVVLFESPNRVMQTLKALAELDETREVLVSRELTKKYESLERKELRSWMETLENISKKGEFTLVIGPREEQKEEACFEQIDSALRECLQEGLSARDASRAVSICLKVSKQKVYQRCQVLSGE